MRSFMTFRHAKHWDFADAKDIEHLRFLLLRRISQKRELGERAYRTIGEDFATCIL